MKKSKKKILYIVTQSEFGGAQRYICDLAKNLPKSQWDVFVAAGGSGEFFSKLAQKNIPNYRIKFLNRHINPVIDLLAYLEIKKLIEKIQPDVVHLNSSKVGLIGSLAAKHALVKNIVYTAHGFIFNEPLGRITRWLYRMIEKNNARRINTIITVSKHDYVTGKAAGIPASKMIVINNAIKKDDLCFLSRQAARSALLPVIREKTGETMQKNKKSGEAMRLIGTIANFYHTKGLDVLIKAIGRTKNTFLIVIGEGSLRPKLEQIIVSLKLTNRVLLIGSLEYAHQYIPAFDLFVLASRKEGLPYTLLEAAAARVPVVATRVGGIPEIIENGINGYLVKPDDARQLAHTITRALERPRNLILHGFEFQTMLSKTITTYKAR